MSDPKAVSSESTAINSHLVSKRKCWGFSASALCVVLLVFSMLGSQIGAAAPVQQASNSGTRIPIDPDCDLTSGVSTTGCPKLPQGVPTAIRIMPSRYRGLSEALLGYRQTGIALVGSNGRTVGPAGAVDDLGGYCLIPWTAVLFKLPLPRSIDLFYFAILSFGLLSGAIGFFFSLMTPIGRCMSVVWVLAVVLVAYHAGDVYIISAVVPLAIVPWLMRVCQGAPRGWLLPVFLFAEGLTVGVAHTVRAHSGTALLIFTLCLLLPQGTVAKARKAWLVAVLLAGVFVPQLCLQALIAKRDAYLVSACPDCPKFTNQHPFWHSVYIGFGFITNEYVPGYNDTVGYARVQAVAPGTQFASAEYDQIMRQEVFTLCRRHSVLVATTLAAKGGVIVGVFLLVANIGLIAAVYYRKPWPIELGFWLAIAFSTLPGLLVIPSSSGYMLGFVTFASLYAVCSLDHAVGRLTTSDSWQVMRGSIHGLTDATPVSAENDLSRRIWTRA